METLEEKNLTYMGKMTFIKMLKILTYQMSSTSRFIPGLQGWFNILKSINIVYILTEKKTISSKIMSIGKLKTFNKIQYPFIT